FTGSGRSGTGILATGTNNNLTITGVNASNRVTGLSIGDAGTDLTVTNNTLTNNTTGLFVNGYSDGADANTVPIIASGNNFTGSDLPLQLFNMTGQFIGTSGTGIIINNATDGLNGTAGTVLRLANANIFPFATLFRSFTGSGRSGTGILATNTN